VTLFANTLPLQAAVVRVRLIYTTVLFLRAVIIHVMAMLKFMFLEGRHHIHFCGVME
jgi:hypothetical protein